MVKLKIKILQDDLDNTERYYKTKPNLDGDAGFDLYFPRQAIVMSCETALVKLSIQVEMISNGTPQSFYVVPRSSIYKTPLRMSNSIGVIDSGYRGELMVPIDNNTDDDYMITPGERLFQIIHPSLKPFDVEIVDELSNSKRGSGGFGSTGK